MSIQFTDNPILGKFSGKDPSDIDAVLSGLRFNVKWLVELSNETPAAFIGREEELYAIMNHMQFVTGRFAKVAP